MVCFRYITVKSLHEGGGGDDDDNDNNNVIAKPRTKIYLLWP
jgi:hypothetical protein